MKILGKWYRLPPFCVDTRALRNKCVDIFTKLKQQVLDEDDMASDSDGDLATQQSIKAYADRYEPYLNEQSDGFEIDWKDAATITIKAQIVCIDGLVKARSTDVDVALTTGGENGLDTGSEDANTWYYVYAITSTGDSDFSGLLSASSTSPILPGGFTHFRRIGSIRNNASSNILRFYKWHKKYFWDSQITVLSERYIGTGQDTVNCTTAVPPTSKLAYINIRLHRAHHIPSHYRWYCKRNSGGSYLYAFSLFSSNEYGCVVFWMPLDANNYWYVIANDGSAKGEIYCCGYDDDV